jgi:hypothetical protein
VVGGGGCIKGEGVGSDLRQERGLVNGRDRTRG